MHCPLLAGLDIPTQRRALGAVGSLTAARSPDSLSRLV
jgi:hypothetical protein